jgi:ATP-dependent Clp protease ATP-binding subunit ClpC
MLEKLSPVSLKCLDVAKREARRLRSPDLNTSHLLIGLLRQQEEWFSSLLKPHGVDTARVVRAAEGHVGSSEHSPSAKLIVSSQLKSVLRQSIARAQGTPVTPAYLLISLLEVDGGIRQLLNGLGVQVAQLVEVLQSAQSSCAPVSGPPSEGSEGVEDRSSGVARTTVSSQPLVHREPTPTLDRYSRDLTHLASEGQLYPVIGREREMAATIEILCRQIKRNPILVGEPGVGKTALAEGLAQRIVDGSIPVQLQDKRLVELSVSSLVAGASQMGEFEKRLRRLVTEVKAAGDIILFIDEAHALMGAGGMYGLQDAATILKPALARGDIVCIGSTTTHEYRKYIEKDGALARRFQPVRVEEPGRDDVLRILEALKPRFEDHFKVNIPDDLLSVTYELSKGYLKNRHFPDKAIDLLERATSRAMLSGGDSPALAVETVLSVLSDITGIPLEKLDQGEMERYLHM